MCGIAGIFKNSFIPDAETMVSSMIDAIVHRGPDGKGTLLFDHACLGHVRLSVIDLAGGGQPMSTPDGKLHISYNGELYNFRELRNNLESEGVRFQTNSDTEVLLLAYRQYGIDAFSKFRGMFAFAVWDSRRQEGLLVRDSFGIKPLFYTNLNGKIIFGSEVKGIIQALPHAPGINLKGLHLLMNFRYIPGDQTLFTGIFHLPPGHCLKWKKDGCKIFKWADESENTKDDNADIDQIRGTLVRAVRRQLVSDVPVGGYLSAGLDSSTILALSVKNKGMSAENFPTFTIQTGDSRFEAQQAGETANFFGVPNHQEPLNIDLDNILPRLIWHLEVPKVNALQSAMVARLAGKYVKVALSGLGGDEIFLGYNIHRILALLESSSTGLKRGSAYLLGHAGQTIFGLMGLRFEELKRGCQALRMLPDFASIYGIIRN
ncbi:MAG: asparagine synthase (glutamine-hydrolyzing), partial [Desulfobulbaceae bacterium]|nr:asparagine synthase (glutamine-hydrolyzing) [Desulfobulbaceae bacterium]